MKLSLIRALIRESLLLELRNAPDSPVPSDSKYYARLIRDGYVLYYAVGPGNKPQAIPGTLGYYFDSTYVLGSKPVSGKDYNLTPDQLEKAEELVALGLGEIETEDARGGGGIGFGRGPGWRGRLGACARDDDRPRSRPW